MVTTFPTLGYSHIFLEGNPECFHCEVLLTKHKDKQEKKQQLSSLVNGEAINHQVISPHSTHPPNPGFIDIFISSLPLTLIMECQTGHYEDQHLCN